MCLDIRPLGFFDGQEGIKAFAQPTSKLRQSVPSSEKIDSKLYLPGRNAVTGAV